MKFDVFTMVRLGWLDGLYREFYNIMPTDFEKSQMSLEQLKEVEVRNAEYWNKIAIILLDFERVEKDYIKAIEECYGVFMEETESRKGEEVESEETFREMFETHEAQRKAYLAFKEKSKSNSAESELYLDKRAQIVDFENDIVWATVNYSQNGSLLPGYSRDVSLIVFYLEKMYSFLTEMKYVDESLKNEMFKILKTLKGQCTTIEWHKECCSKREEIYSLSRDENIKFEIFTMFRNEWLDALYLEFYARMYIFNNLKSVRTSEQIKEIEMINAGYWNEVAKILLDSEKMENDELGAKKACFEVFKEEHKSLNFVKNKFKKKEPNIVYFLDNIVGSKWISNDVRFVVYYLKAMYDCLTKVELPYVDEILKNEMMKQIKNIESI